MSENGGRKKTGDISRYLQRVFGIGDNWWSARTRARHSHREKDGYALRGPRATRAKVRGEGKGESEAVAEAEAGGEAWQEWGPRGGAEGVVTSIRVPCSPCFLPALVQHTALALQPSCVSSTGERDARTRLTCAVSAVRGTQVVSARPTRGGEARAGVQGGVQAGCA